MSRNKTIKFFISSTFKDFEPERNILQKFVFPKLKELCNKKGFGFQPIDLRWGIQEEAGLDQQTMNICLNEIKRSSHEPKPNLLILVGQRYGWIPLPYEMEKEEFEIIITSNKLLDEDKNLINNWYEKDENSIENIYYLKNKHHLTREEWNEIEEQIRVSFQKVFDNPKDEDIYRKYNTSATEQEMYLGLDKFQKEVDNSHTFAYFRKIINYNNEKVSDYIDKDLTKLKKLWKKLRKNSNIPKENQNIQKNVQWNEIKQSKNISYNELNLEKIPFYLKEFHDQILEKFTISIQKEINDFEEQTQLQIELEQQENFLKEKSEIVLGRDVDVERILGFIKNNHEQFYLQYGKSGSGKTSVMAKAISEISTKEYEVYYRFIGTTANSTYSRILFENIFWEIEANLQNKNDLPKPNIEIEEREFKKQFKLQLEKLNNKKVVIFLDALDQFEDYNDLTILLDNLPLNIKIVFSTLYDENKKDNSDYSEYFNRLSYLKIKYELLPLDISTNKEILEKLLESQNRKLTIKQWEKINSNLENITPLHLRLIFEIVKHWKSKQNDLYLENTEKKLIIHFFEFIVKQYHHEKKLLKLSLGYISASKDGLSEEEILDLFSNDTNFLKLFQNHRYPSLNRLPNAIWSRFYYYVQNIFTEKLIDGEMLIKPYHRIIEEVIKENFYAKNAKKLHKHLSDSFYLKQDNSKTWNERYYSLRMLSELPYQLYKSKNSKLLKEILFDLEFAGSIYDNNKQENFRDIMSKATQLDNITENKLYPWESFYREKEHLILKVDEALWRPHQSLFQLAYEDGLDSSLTKEAEKIIKQNKVKWKWLKIENQTKKSFRKGLLKIINKYKNITNTTYKNNKLYFNSDKNSYSMNTSNFDVKIEEYDYHINVLREKYSHMNDDVFFDILDEIIEEEKKQGELNSLLADELLADAIKDYQKLKNRLINIEYIDFLGNNSNITYKNGIIYGCAWTNNDNNSTVLYIENNWVIKEESFKGNIKNILFANDIFLIDFGNYIKLKNKFNNFLLIDDFLFSPETFFYDNINDKYILVSSSEILIYKISHYNFYSVDNFEYKKIKDDLIIMKNNSIFKFDDNIIYKLKDYKINDFIEFSTNQYFAWNEDIIFLISKNEIKEIVVRGYFIGIPDFFEKLNGENEKIDNLCKISNNLYSVITSKNVLYFLYYNSDENIFYVFLNSEFLEKANGETNFKLKFLNKKLYLYNTDKGYGHVTNLLSSNIKIDLSLVEFDDDLAIEQVINKPRQEYCPCNINNTIKITEKNLFYLEFAKKMLNIRIIDEDKYLNIDFNYKMIVFDELDIIKIKSTIYVLYKNKLTIIINDKEILNLDLSFGNESFNRFFVSENQLYICSKNFIQKIKFNKKNKIYFTDKEVIGRFNNQFVSIVQGKIYSYKIGEKF